MWGKKSLYTLKPDPSLILPEKFNYTSKKDSDWDRAIFTVNRNDPTALKMRGVRFYMTDYDIESTNILLRGLKYTVRVPVYNASFKDTGPFSVRLSLAANNDFDATRTTVGEVRFENIAGWGNGNSRQFAEFVWSPDVGAGEYYLFVDIDPDNEVDEVHENRRNANGVMVDSGGNNMGYCRIGIAEADAPVPDASKLLLGGRSTDPSSFNMSFVDTTAKASEFSVSASETADLYAYFERHVSGDSYVPVGIDVTYSGDYLVKSMVLSGYKLKPGVSDKAENELTDDDTDFYFLNSRFSVIPGELHRVRFMMNPEYLEDGVRFKLTANGEELQVTEVIRRENAVPADVGVTSSSGGCEAVGSLLGLAVIGVMMIRKKTK